MYTNANVDLPNQINQNKILVILSFFIPSVLLVGACAFFFFAKVDFVRASGICVTSEAHAIYIFQ